MAICQEIGTDYQVVPEKQQTTWILCNHWSLENTRVLKTY